MDDNTNVEIVKDAVNERKLPFKRVKYAVNQLVNTAIPLHIQLIADLSNSIEYLKDKDCPLELRQHQIQAAKAIRLLKADLYEIDHLNLQIAEEDREIFYRTIEVPIKNAVETLSAFMALHSDVLDPLLDIDNKPSGVPLKIPDVVCDHDSASPDDYFEIIEEDQVIQTNKLVESKSSYKSLDFLRKELVEIHSLIRHFSSLVFRQQENVDSIQSNLVETHENVREGTRYLYKASLFKAASFPLTGALIGGLVLGPIGAVAGFKLFGTVAGVACVAGTSIAGYQAGKTLKKRQQRICDIEMKALTYPSKTASSSTPDLSTDFDSEKEKTS